MPCVLPRAVGLEEVTGTTSTLLTHLSVLLVAVVFRPTTRCPPLARELHETCTRGATSPPWPTACAVCCLACGGGMYASPGRTTTELWLLLPSGSGSVADTLGIASLPPVTRGSRQHQGQGTDGGAVALHVPTCATALLAEGRAVFHMPERQPTGQPTCCRLNNHHRIAQPTTNKARHPLPSPPLLRTRTCVTAVGWSRDRRRCRATRGAAAALGTPTSHKPHPRHRCE